MKRLFTVVAVTALSVGLIVAPASADPGNGKGSPSDPLGIPEPATFFEQGVGTCDIEDPEAPIQLLPLPAMVARILQGDDVFVFTAPGEGICVPNAFFNTPGLPGPPFEDPFVWPNP